MRTPRAARSVMLTTTMSSQRTRTPAPRRVHRPLVTQFLKFGLVGASNTLIPSGAHTIRLKGLGVWYLAASGIGFAVGAVNGFLLNHSWTFRGHAGGDRAALR